MTTLYDQKALIEATAFLNDEFRETMTEENRRNTTRLMKKWQWYLEGEQYGLKPLPSKMWPTMAHLFENQIRTNKPVRDLFEASTLSQVVLPDKYSIPLIRAIFPPMIMNRICSVQPMPMASAGKMNVYYYNIYREDTSPEELVTVNRSNYAASSEGAVPKKLRQALTSTSVTATKDMLAATWSMEIQEEMQGVMGIDVEREMLDAIAEEILRELEQRVIQAIVDEAGAGTVTWHYTVGTGYLATEWYQTLFHSMLDAERLVRVARYRRCNYIIAGTTAVTYLKKASAFRAGGDTGLPEGPLQSGVLMEGSIDNQWQVWSSDYMDANTMIMSYYPISTLHAGYVWAPYVPLTPMPLMYGEMADYDDATMPGAMKNTDMFTRNVRTRNARKMLQPNMFAKILIAA